MHVQEPSKYHYIRDFHRGIFNSANGHLIDINNAHKSPIDINDIAVGLSNICRFGGQVKNFYSVAQHSVFVMHLAPDNLKREALMHDAAEAYLGDVIKPLKNILGPTYKWLEDNFMVEISLRFGLDINKLEAIKEYDLTALELEHEALQKGNAVPLVVSMNMNDMLETQQHCFWDNVTARVAFLKEFNKLFL